MLRPTRMEVHLGRIQENYRSIRSHVGARAQVMGVVKANAYGTGMVPVASALREAGCTRFAVATPEEALELRKCGIGDPILVMGASPADAAGELVAQDVAATVADLSFAQVLSREATRQGRPARFHLKVDTGMGRIGFLPQELPSLLPELLALGNLDFEGVFTHFATADEERLDYTWTQFRRFGDVLEELRDRGVGVRLRHACNSAALMRCPEMHLDAVRPGVILYGLRPSPGCPVPFPLSPAFEVKTSVAALRELPPGSGVSYGLRYVTRGQERLAVLPLGYRDGYVRALAGKAEVLIRGHRVPVVGTICMDQCLVDVTSLPEVCVGDEVVLLGRQGDCSIEAEEMARWLGTIVYEIPGLFSERVPRIHLEG